MKEVVVRLLYETGGSESHRTSGITYGGVYCCGKVKSLRLATKAKARTRSFGEGAGTNLPEVTAVRPETNRFTPEQDEILLPKDGGPQPVLV